jgi:hypothetical protein
VSSKFGVYKFLVFSEILVHSFKPPISDYTKRVCNHVESTGDAQEKQARSYELEFRWKLKIFKLQISSSLDLTINSQ